MLGELSNERVVGLAERLESWLYGNADVIVTVTEPIRRHIAERSAPGSRIDVIATGSTRNAPFVTSSRHTSSDGDPQ